jgi:hypothetical protein
MKCGWWSTLPLGYTEAMYQILLGRDPIIHQTAADAPPMDLVSWADCHALNQRLRRDGCTAKQGLYAWSFTPSHHSPMFGWTGANHEGLLHTLGGSALVGPDPHPSGLMAKIINWADEGWRNNVILAWVNWMRHPDPVNYPDASYDILVFDYDGYHHYAEQTLRLAGPGGTLEHGTPPLSWEWWWEHLTKFKTELREALESEGKMLITNGISPRTFDSSDPLLPFYGQNYCNLADYTSGVLAEHLCKAWLSPNDFLQNFGMILNQLTKRRQIYMVLMPSLLPETDPGHAGGPAMEQFLWTFYKLLEDPGQTVPFYHDGAPWRGTTLDQTQPYVWDSGILSQLDIGYPIEGPNGGPDGVIWRRFSAGYAMANISAEAKAPTVQRLCRVWDKVNGALVGGGAGTFNMPGRSFWLLPYV